MSMSIWLPIVTNAVLALIVIAGMLIGRKTKWYLEMFKFICLAGAGVGAHFLIPTMNELLLKIPFVAQINESLALGAGLNSISFALMFIAAYIVLSIMFGIINHIVCKERKGIKVSRTVKVAAANHKADRELKRIKRAERKRNPFGVIFGMLVGLLVSFVIFMPMKYAAKEVVKLKPELSEIEKGVEYTAFGQLDKYTNVVEFIIEK